MSGHWVAYIPTHKAERDKPRVTKLAAKTHGRHPTRKAALAALRKDLERQHKAAQEKVAEVVRALANLLELEEERT